MREQAAINGIGRDAGLVAGRLDAEYEHELRGSAPVCHRVAPPMIVIKSWQHIVRIGAARV
jgi:hypothetical protein